jgi:hypothetical protein
MTNKELSTSYQFLELCIRHSVTATKRQASKLRNRKGELYSAMRRSGHDTGAFRKPGRIGSGSGDL